MSTLTAEQRQRIEENRRLALEKRAAKLNVQNVTKFYSNTNNQNSTSTNSPSVQSSSNLFPPPAPPKPKPQPSSLIQNGNVRNIFKKRKQQKTNECMCPTDKWNTFADKYSKNQTKTWNVQTENVVGICSLISRDRFVVDMPYNQQAIDIFKTIPDKQYDATTKKWNFPISEFDNLKKKIAPLAPSVTLGNIPKCVLRIMKEATADKVDHKTIDISKIDPVLMNSLFEFQKEGVQFGVSKKGKCLIADEMGLGKTLQALGIASYYMDDWPLLIVCPSSMRYQWEEELLKYLPKVPSYSVMVITNGKSIIEDVKVVILSYDLLAKLKDTIMEYGFGFIIFDESHKLKNIKTQRSKAALAILQKAKRIVLLSGTPALSRPIELYTQIKVLQPNLFREMQEFGVRYCEGKQDRFGWNFQGSSNLEELKLILEEKIMIRRLKANVLDQLPSKMRQVVSLSPELIDTSSGKMRKLESKLMKEQNMSGSERRSTLLEYYTETGRTKIKAIVNYVEELLEQEKKFLCFAHHKVVLDAVCELLEKKEVFYIRIDGSVSSEERKSVCDQFQEEEKFKVAVLSITAANTGLTLTAAQLVVFAELFWNPGELIQAEDRAHRIGQKNCVFIQYLIAKGTADDYIWPLVQSKLNILKQAGLSKENKLSVEETNSQSSQGKKQASILEYFSQMDDDINEDVLTDLMDEIDASILEATSTVVADDDEIPEKRTKLS